MTINIRTFELHTVYWNSKYRKAQDEEIGLNTLRTGSFKLFKRPFPGFLTTLTL